MGDAGGLNFQLKALRTHLCYGTRQRLQGQRMKAREKNKNRNKNWREKERERERDEEGTKKVRGLEAHSRYVSNTQVSGRQKEKFTVQGHFILSEK